jgi:hypothetical protein
VAVKGQRAAFEAGMRDTARALALVVDAEIAGLEAFATSPGFGPVPDTPDLPVLDAHAQ